MLPRAPGQASPPSDSASVESAPLGRRLARSFAFSSGLAAAIGASLTLVAARALEAPGSRLWALLAASGTFIVYNLDRLRDVEQDRKSSPLRTAYIERNRERLYVAVGFAALALAAGLLNTPIPVIALLAVIGSIGLFHRRLKGFTQLKAAYVSVAWAAACIGMPWIASGRDLGAGAWISAILLPTLAANLVASNLGDEGFGDLDVDDSPRHRILDLRSARAFCAFALVVALVAPADFRPLLWIPVCEGIALAGYRPEELYRAIVVDGAILLGALASFIHFGWSA